eukprot:gnl/TRDRNA2_/TRDRNA2_32277_c0_seq1.p1 gnl/TRDRNA2_/TRDRNA2_32277_c0~~gnl/TRDRNA2_/TRDRNA2_32277_c0_seq1.p1  ORF type:complete len:282 (+),score=52.79 gnl/TRDRNA2_/TRDRNA2_32277_c0_seq1:115-960(+)
MAGNLCGVGDVVEVLRAKYGCRRGDRLRVLGESRMLWKLEGGKTIPKIHDQIGWRWVQAADGETEAAAQEKQRRLTAASSRRLTSACIDGHIGYVIDDAFDDSFLESLEAFRLSIPLDTTKKKTAAARRFFHDADGVVRAELVRVLNAELHVSDASILPWMRFLEYNEVEGALPPHTDALIRCKESGRWSTHTLILFCSDCASGGETVMLTPSLTADDAGKTADEADDAGKTTDQAGESFAVSPTRGRLFCFPHQCLHEGRPTISVPKILLRAELILESPG